MGWRRKRRNPPLPIRGEDAANAAGEGTADGAQAPSPCSPKRLVIPAKAGTYPHRGGRASASPAQPQRSKRCSFGAKKCSFSAHGVLIRRSRSAHSVLTECSPPPDGALPSPQALRRPSTQPRKPDSPSQSEPAPRLPQAAPVIMTQPYCVPLRLLLSCTPIERPGRPARRRK